MLNSECTTRSPATSGMLRQPQRLPWHTWECVLYQLTGIWNVFFIVIIFLKHYLCCWN